MESLRFQCNSCGACCRIAGKSGLMPSQENGACIYLTEDNKCSVYDQRPILCNVDKMYQVRKSVCDGKFPLIKFTMTKKDYFKTNSLHCNELMELEGMPKELRIDISEYDKMQE